MAQSSRASASRTLHCRDASGRDVVIVVVKGTFALDEAGVMRPADEQMPVRIGDEVYAPDAEDSSIRLPSDVVPEKVGADVVVVGSAVSMPPERYMDVVVAAVAAVAVAAREASP